MISKTDVNLHTAINLCISGWYAGLMRATEHDRRTPPSRTPSHGPCTQALLTLLLQGNLELLLQSHHDLDLNIVG